MIDAEHRADDIGTRLDHLMQLHEIWSWGYAQLTRPNITYRTPGQEDDARKLLTAIEMLNYQLRAFDNPTEIAREINQLPNAKDIPNT